jgi:hypothetical protein
MLTEFEQGGFSQAAWVCGRRGGKSLLADVLVCYDAVVRDELRAMLRPGELRVAAIVAPRLEQAQAHIGNCARLLEQNPRLNQLVVSRTETEITLANRSVIRAYPCSARTVRGDAWSSAALDEFAHFFDSTDGPACGDRVWQAVLPAVSQFGDRGWVLALSTPRWRQGAFYALTERATSGRFTHIHHAHHSTGEMNPRIKKSWLEERRREDPDLYGREFLAEFIDGASSYLSSSDVVGAVRGGVGILSPQAGIRYVGMLDPAFERDSFTLAVGHKTEDSVVIDGCWAWTRKGYEATLDEVAGVANAYRLHRLQTDQYAARPIVEGLTRRGFGVDVVAWNNPNKAEAFARLKVCLSTGTLELPDDCALVEELCALEARPTEGGATKIAASSRGHDDRAVAVAGCVFQLKRASISPDDLKKSGELLSELRSARSTRSSDGYERAGIAKGWGSFRW